MRGGRRYVHRPRLRRYGAHGAVRRTGMLLPHNGGQCLNICAGRHPLLACALCISLRFSSVLCCAITTWGEHEFLDLLAFCRGARRLQWQSALHDVRIAGKPGPCRITHHFGSQVPGMDMVSYGPTIRGAHSPEERVEIATVAPFWEATLRLLGRLADRRA